MTEIIETIKTIKNKKEIYIPTDKKGKPMRSKIKQDQQAYNQKGKLETAEETGEILDTKI